jgi:hypothetical protein
MTGITVPDTVTDICPSAFFGCVSLKDIPDVNVHADRLPPEEEQEEDIEQ